MAKGAHRKIGPGPIHASSDRIEADFQRRVAPSLTYCVQVGNVYSATLYLALCGLIDHENLSDFNRIGLFSDGSGCSSEFYSGIVSAYSKSVLREMKIGERLAARYPLNIDEHDHWPDLNAEWTFGIQNKEVDFGAFAKITIIISKGSNCWC